MNGINLKLFLGLFLAASIGLSGSLSAMNYEHDQQADVSICWDEFLPQVSKDLDELVAEFRGQNLRGMLNRTHLLLELLREVLDEIGVDDCNKPIRICFGANWLMLMKPDSQRKLQKFSNRVAQLERLSPGLFDGFAKFQELCPWLTLLKHLDPINRLANLPEFDLLLKWMDEQTKNALKLKFRK